MGDLVVLGRALLASADEPLRDGWGVWIDTGAIGGAGPNEALLAEHPEAKVIDARGLLLLPGLVDAHRHAYGLLAHGFPIADNPGEFDRFLSEFWWPRVEDRLDRAMIEAAMARSCARMIRSGVTAFCDVLEAPNAPEGILDVEASVVRRAGLRAVLMTEASERVDAARGGRLLAENARFVDDHRGDESVRGMLCLHTSFTCSAPFVERACRLRDDLGCGLHVHLCESSHEPKLCMERHGMRPAAWYDRLGLWDGFALASQAVAVDDGEIDLLARRGVRVAHMPQSNCEIGGGVAPVPTMIERGMRPGLGTDGYLDDPFELMRSAFLIHKGVRRDPTVMPSRQVVHMATDWAAEAIGFPACGTIAPGKSADLIGIDLDFDTPVMEANVLDQIVLHRNAENVRLSVVGGRVLMEGGELLTLSEDETRAAVREQANRLWKGV